MQAKFALLSVCLFALTSPAWTQEASQDAIATKSASTHGILGYLDAKTGAFRPLAQASELSPALSFTTFTGEIEYKITVTIKSSISTSTPIACSGDASVFDETSGVSHDEEATVTATRSGSTATCTVLIPYAWALASASSDSVSLGYHRDCGKYDAESLQYPYPSSNQGARQWGDDCRNCCSNHLNLSEERGSRGYAFLSTRHGHGETANIQVADVRLRQIQKSHDTHSRSL
jgi:hypothetical protein